MHQFMIIQWKFNQFGIHTRFSMDFKFHLSTLTEKDSDFEKKKNRINSATLVMNPPFSQPKFVHPKLELKMYFIFEAK